MKDVGYTKHIHGTLELPEREKDSVWLGVNNTDLIMDLEQK